VIAAVDARPNTDRHHQEGLSNDRAEQDTVLQGLDLWRKAVGAMSWEARAAAALALLIVGDDELEELRRRIQAGEIQ
jgi:hypothetical protein